MNYFKYTKEDGTVCTNADPVTNLNYCNGYCESVTIYSSLMLGFENECHCCQAVSTESVSVDLTCTDGSNIARSYEMPTQCGCGICGDDDETTTPGA